MTVSNVGETPDQPERKSKRERARIALEVSVAGISALVIVAAAPGAVEMLKNPKPVVHEIEVEAAPPSIEEDATSAAITTALAVLNILESEGSGAEGYNGGFVGNKLAVIGPDGVWPSQDDNPTPTSFVSFDTVTDKLTFSSGQGGMLNGGFRGDLVQIFFNVDDDNPIQSIHTQLTTEDFRAALEDTTTIELDKIDVSTNLDNGDYVDAELSRDENGVLTPHLIGDNQVAYSTPGSVTVETDEGKNAAQRILQLSGTVTEKLDK